jgi:hypothetical protein
MTISCFVIANYCEAHDAFYPHHLKDIKAAAKRGKILVITLIVSAGLVVLVSTAVLKSGKEEDEADSTENIAPSELRASVMAAVIAGQKGLEVSREEAINMALSAYARERGIEREERETEYTPSSTYAIGKDRVTVSISDDGSIVEVSAICGKIGANAIANIGDDSTHSSIFSSH